MSLAMSIAYHTLPLLITFEMVYPVYVTGLWVLLGKYLNKPSFTENLCGSPSGDTRQASLPAADQVHPQLHVW